MLEEKKTLEIYSQLFGSYSTVTMTIRGRGLPEITSRRNTTGNNINSSLNYRCDVVASDVKLTYGLSVVLQPNSSALRSRNPSSG